MVQSARHFDSFEPHTLLKHAILRAYEERWARVLLVRPDSPRTRVRIVDACAGAGQDEIGNPGSPLISIREAEKARGQLSAMRGEPVEVQVVAIEKDRARYAQLEQVVQAFGGRHQAWCGTLGDHIARLEPDFSTTPTLFFIDPFGLDPLQAEVVRRALRGAHNEVLLLFADQAALRHIGAAAAMDASEEQPLSLFEDIGLPAPTASRELQGTAEAAIRIMTAAFGGDRWKVAMKHSPERRREVLVDMYAEMLTSMGARRVLSLPMIGKGSRLKYHLMFATKSGKGYEVMKDSVERAWNRDLVDDRAVQLMRMGVAAPTAAIEKEVRRRFAGQRRVSWTGKRSSESVRLFALQDTPAMPHQLEELTQRLKPLRVPGERAFVYDFSQPG
jgi:three-Cys-motif partner protein